MTIRATICALILAAGFMAMGAEAVQAAIFFDDSFEGSSPEASGWVYTYSHCTGSPCPYVDVSSDFAHSGSKSLKLSYTRPASENPATITVGLYHGFKAVKDVWKRYWYRTKGFTYGVVGTKHMYTGGEMPYFYSANMNGSRELTMVGQVWADLKYSTANFYPNMKSIPLLDGETRIAQEKNPWYCIEEHTKLNTPGRNDGMVEAWVDGVQTIGYYNRTILGPNVINTNGNSSEHSLSSIKFYKESGNGLMYYDQVAVGDQRIGCGSGSVTTPGDTTPPTAPTAFTVN